MLAVDDVGMLMQAKAPIRWGIVLGHWRRSWFGVIADGMEQHRL